MTRDRAPALPFKGLATGPDPKKAADHQDKAGYHQMMATFYTLSQRDQRAFLAWFEEVTR